MEHNLFGFLVLNSEPAVVNANDCVFMISRTSKRAAYHLESEQSKTFYFFFPFLKNFYYEISH